jgi:electron transport complex protein RnfE
LPLIVVNCIILARAEAFASTNTVGDSILYGLGMGLGFTLSLMTMGFIRELVGSGTVFVGSLGETEFGLVLGNLPDYALSVFVMPAGGFLVFGLLMALINWLTDKSEQRKKEKLIAEAERIEDMKRYIAAMEAVDAVGKVENLEGEEVEA